MSAKDFFAAPTWGRRPNLDRFLAYLEETFPHGGGFLVEIGGMRDPGNVNGDGCASVAFATHATRRGETFVSVDVDEAAVRQTQRLADESRLDVLAVHGRGERILQCIHGPIHLLYLDGSNDPQETLGQFACAVARFVKGSLLVVDDQHVKAPLLAARLAALDTIWTPFPTDEGCNQKAWTRTAGPEEAPRA